MRKNLSLALAALFAAMAPTLLGSSAPETAGPANPFNVPSALPYQAPPFDRIHDDDYAPAIEEGMKQQLAEVQKIAEDPAAPTFANTIEALERSGELLTRVTKVFFDLAQSNTNERLQK